MDFQSLTTNKNYEWKPLKKSRRGSSLSRWSQPGPFSSMSRYLVRTKIYALINAAIRAVRIFLAQSLQTHQTNDRFYDAVLLMLVLAPLSTVTYQLFDEGVRGDIEYYENYFYLFYTIGPWVALAIFCLGVVLLFPADSKRAYFIALPLSFAIVKILWLVQIKSNAEFHQIIPFYFFLPAASIAFLFVFCFHWLMSRKFHKHDGLRRRMDGIFDAPIDDGAKVKYLKTTWTDLKTFLNEN